MSFQHRISFPPLFLTLAAGFNTLHTHPSSPYLFNLELGVFYPILTHAGGSNTSHPPPLSFQHRVSFSPLFLTPAVGFNTLHPHPSSPYLFNIELGDFYHTLTHAGGSNTSPPPPLSFQRRFGYFFPSLALHTLYLIFLT